MTTQPQPFVFMPASAIAAGRVSTQAISIAEKDEGADRERLGAGIVHVAGQAANGIGDAAQQDGEEDDPGGDMRLLVELGASDIGGGSWAAVPSTYRALIRPRTTVARPSREEETP
ncbi:hypothetical protein [Plastoroseomonas hellenica]|uniref:hypothetical protein n=1 Tax=Plastoroseomonas hellenica TaxID=2687306 RepID=UPI0020133BB3|nr:hypothetical protein [Plastoroseomonas hellenica]